MTESKSNWCNKVVDIVASKLEVTMSEAAYQIRIFEEKENDLWRSNFEKGINQYDTGEFLFNEITKL